MHCNKPNKSENHSFFSKTRASILFLGFQYFELCDILSYEIFINEFQYSVVSLFIDSRVGLVSLIWFVLAQVLNCKNNFTIAKLTIWVWCGVAIMFSYRCLLTNRLHGKAAEICLANNCLLSEQRRRRKANDG